MEGELREEIRLASGEQLSVRELPAVERMATCVRIGLPERAHLITGKIGVFMEANGYTLAGPSREVFLQPPRLDRMEESVVEMQFPVAKVASLVSIRLTADIFACRRQSLSQVRHEVQRERQHV